MQTLRNLPILFLSLCVVLVLSLQGCTGNRYERSTGERLDDAVITTRVKSNIIANPHLKFFDITVDTFRGVVQLGGFVDNEKIIRLAEKVAAETPGVVKVNNRIAVKPANGH